MSRVSLSGNDTLIIDDRVFADLADDDAAVLDFAEDIAVVKKGKNGNTIYAFSQGGKICGVTIRVLRGSPDDKYLNARYEQMKANFAGFPLVIGRFIKKIGDGEGNVTNDTYIMSGGVFTRAANAKTNQQGDTEQSVSIYVLTFGDAPRAIG